MMAMWRTLIKRISIRIPEGKEPDQQRKEMSGLDQILPLVIFSVLTAALLVFTTALLVLTTLAGYYSLSLLFGATFISSVLYAWFAIWAMLRLSRIRLRSWIKDPAVLIVIMMPFFLLLGTLPPEAPAYIYVSTNYFTYMVALFWLAWFHPRRRPDGKDGFRKG